MAKKLTLLLLLFAACLWAADFWIAKPYTEWNDKEISKILSDSPWVGKVTISMAPAGGGGGGAPSGKGGGNGPRGESAENAAPGGGSSGPEVTLLWQTALPIKQALMKRKFGSEVAASPEAKGFIDRKDEVYALTMAGLPANLAQAAQGDKKAVLLGVTTLEVKGKEPVKAMDVQVSAAGRNMNLSFLFPRTTNFTAEDKEFEFVTKFDKTTVKHKFKLKDMVFNGKVEM